MPWTFIIQGFFSKWGVPDEEEEEENVTSSREHDNGERGEKVEGAKGVVRVAPTAKGTTHNAYPNFQEISSLRQKMHHFGPSPSLCLSSSSSRVESGFLSPVRAREMASAV